MKCHLKTICKFYEQKLKLGSGSVIWKLEKVAFGILRLCNGKKSLEQIVEDVSKRIEYKPEEVKPVIKDILRELAKMRFVEWLNLSFLF